MRCMLSLSYSSTILRLLKNQATLTARNSFGSITAKQISRTFTSTHLLRMATSSRVKLDPSHRPVFAVPKLSQELADKVSGLLQTNHEEHHVFFNQEGFHVQRLPYSSATISLTIARIEPHRSPPPNPLRSRGHGRPDPEAVRPECFLPAAAGAVEEEYREGHARSGALQELSRE